MADLHSKMMDMQDLTLPTIRALSDAEVAQIEMEANVIRDEKESIDVRIVTRRCRAKIWF